MTKSRPNGTIGKFLSRDHQHALALSSNVEYDENNSEPEKEGLKKLSRNQKNLLATLLGLAILAFATLVGLIPQIYPEEAIRKGASLNRPRVQITDAS